MTDNSRENPIPLWLAVIPLILLIAMLAGSVTLFGDSSSYGPNQIALMLRLGWLPWSGCSWATNGPSWKAPWSRVLPWH